MIKFFNFSRDMYKVFDDGKHIGTLWNEYYKTRHWYFSPIVDGNFSDAIKLDNSLFLSQKILKEALQ